MVVGFACLVGSAGKAPCMICRARCAATMTRRLRDCRPISCPLGNNDNASINIPPLSPLMPVQRGEVQSTRAIALCQHDGFKFSIGRLKVVVDDDVLVLLVRLDLLLGFLQPSSDFFGSIRLPVLKTLAKYRERRGQQINRNGPRVPLPDLR